MRDEESYERLQSCSINSTARFTIPRRQTLYFDYDKSDISPKADIIIKEHAAYLRANPAAFLHLSDHTYERGTNGYNFALAERRINEVKKMLIFLGVIESQFVDLNYGEEQPAAFGHYEKAWRLNRRVKLIYPVRGQENFAIPYRVR